MECRRFGQLTARSALFTSPTSLPFRYRSKASAKNELADPPNLDARLGSASLEVAASLKILVVSRRLQRLRGYWSFSLSLYRTSSKCQFSSFPGEEPTYGSSCVLALRVVNVRFRLDTRTRSRQRDTGRSVSEATEACLVCQLCRFDQIDGSEVGNKPSDYKSISINVGIPSRSHSIA
jgi:hypothetical protein